MSQSVIKPSFPPFSGINRCDYIVTRLEDAGATLIALSAPRHGMPNDLRAAWPAVRQAAWDVLGPAEVGTVTERQHLLEAERHRSRIPVERAAVDRLDEVLEWLWLIRRPLCRRTVFARMQVWPDSGRHVHSWASIARVMRSSVRSVRRWHDEGVDDIATS